MVVMDHGVAEVVFTSLLLQATKAAVRQRPPPWSGESKTALRRPWMVGFSSEVYRKLLAAERTAVRDTTIRPRRVGGHQQRWSWPTGVPWSTGQSTMSGDI
jgi:hypothetical protein